MGVGACCVLETAILRILISLYSGACLPQGARTPCFCFLCPVPTLCHRPLRVVTTILFHSWLQFMFLFLHQVPQGSLLTLLLSLINVTSLLPTSCSPLWMVNSVLPPLGTALRVLWGRCGGPGAGRLPALVSIESQQPPLLLNILLGLQLLQSGLGRDFD